MRIIIVGAGKVGWALTQHLSAENQVTVIDQRADLIDNIINIYDVMGICGNGASYEIQQEADVDKADLLIATTSSDEVNIVACLVAKKMGVQHPYPQPGIRAAAALYAGGSGPFHGHQPGKGGCP